MLKNISPFLIDQKGGPWFFGGVIVACVLGLGFRLVFSSARIEKEAILALAKLEPEIKLNFKSARLLVVNKYGLPGIYLYFSELQGFYTPDIYWKNPIKIRADYVQFPISFFELIQGQVSLNEVFFGELFVHFPDGFWDYLKNRRSFQLEKSKIPQINTATAKEIKKLDTEFRSNYQVKQPRPIKKVKINRLLMEGLIPIDIGINFRDLILEVADDGEATLEARTVIQSDFGIEHKGMLIFMDYHPKDQFLIGRIVGRLREGLIHGGFNIDNLSESFNFEIKGETIPLPFFIRVFELFLDKKKTTILDFFIKSLQKFLPKESWTSFEFNSMGYFNDYSRGLQLSLRHFKAFSKEKQIDSVRIFQIFQNQDWTTEPFQIEVNHLNWPQWKHVGWDDDLFLVLQDGNISGLIDVLSTEEFSIKQAQIFKGNVKLGEKMFFMPKGELFLKKNESVTQIKIQSDLLTEIEGKQILEGFTYEYETHKKNVRKHFIYINQAKSDTLSYQDVRINKLNQEIKFGELKTSQENWYQGHIKLWEGSGIIYDTNHSSKSLKAFTSQSEGALSICLDQRTSKKESQLNHSLCFDFWLGRFAF